jgi:hypothetical protein
MSESHIPNSLPNQPENPDFFTNQEAENSKDNILSSLQNSMISLKSLN